MWEHLQPLAVSLFVLVLIFEAFVVMLSPILGKKGKAKLSVTNWGPKAILAPIRLMFVFAFRLIGTIGTGIYRFVNQEVFCPLRGALNRWWLTIPQTTRTRVHGIFAILLFALVLYLVNKCT